MRAFLLFACMLLSCAAAQAQEYRLVWSDEFDTDGPHNSQSWGFERGFVRNREAQWYQQDNAMCKDGVLVIEARRESKPLPEGAGRRRGRERQIEYTSSSINTRGRHSWQFGRFEVRARIDARPGLWPAIWLLGERGEWPSCGEIDMMEYYDHSLLANAAWGTTERYTAEWDSSQLPLEKLGGDDWAKEFHVWRMDWDEKSIKLYVDDRLLNEIDLTKTINPTGNGPTNPFHQPHYMLLNLAVGGTRGGDPSNTEFPSRFEVDYVRVYQRE
jgi:beta-glucanase (GH16 family)